MKLGTTLLAISILASTAAFAQTDIDHPSTGTVTTATCDANYYDDGGPSSNYSNNVNSVQIFCPDTPGMVTSVEFDIFRLRNNGDTLTIRNGDQGTDPVLDTLFGNLNGSTPFSYTSTDDSGCLYFEFVSNGNNTRRGWEAAISCADTVCGNGAIEPGEDCDDGNLIDGDDCSATCEFEGACCTNGPGTFSECIIATENFCLTYHSLYLGDGTDCAGVMDCTALNVELDSMTATATRRGVQIEWTTATEMETVGFRILRVRDEGREKSSRYVSGVIPSAASGFSGADYRFLDNSNDWRPGDRYVLEDIDIYGKTTQHPAVSIERSNRGEAPGRRQR